MKNNHRRLKALFKLIPEESFFSVNYGNYDITLIAFYSPGLVARIQRNKFRYSETVYSDFLKYQRGKISILITEHTH